MELKKITAIIDSLQLDRVHKALESHGVTGFSIQPVKGRGKYCNTYSRDNLVEHIQIDLFVDASHANDIVELIIKTADVGADSEGLVTVIPIESLYWIKGQVSAQPSDFNFTR